MASFTSKAIKETFMDLLYERPLNEITVKDIVKTCGINRNTFYYHFRDLPALIEEIIQEEAEAIIEKYKDVDSFEDCLAAIYEFVSHQKRQVMHIYKSVNREVFEKHLMDVCEYFVKNYLSTAFFGEKTSEKARSTIINYYKCVCFGLTIDALNNDLSDEHAKMVRRVLKLKIESAHDIAAMMR